MSKRPEPKPHSSSQRAPPILLSGQNPQIAKGYGEAPVRAYLDAVPGWKQAVCRRIDAIVTELVPGVRKAVKWNSPLYGIEEGSWFLSYHCFTNYVKVSFLQGSNLAPRPPGPSKDLNVRYLDIREQDILGDQFRDWVLAASKLPGTRM